MSSDSVTVGVGAAGVRSMTGFGGWSTVVGRHRVSVEVRSVNHRFFTPSIKLPSVLSALEGEVREAMRRSVVRGHVTLTVKMALESGTAASAIDGDAFGGALRILRELASEYALPPVQMSDVLRLPGVVTGDAESFPADGGPEVLRAVEGALKALDRMRSEEGERLLLVLRQRLGKVARSTQRVAERAPERFSEQFEKLRSGVQRLLGEAAVDEARVAQELAVMSERLDIAEELDRMRSHLMAFEETLAFPSPDGVGKRLGFILQEMLREVNTMGSKGADSLILSEVVAMKEELERLREQCENIE